jgi:hypothetical protein
MKRLGILVGIAGLNAACGLAGKTGAMVGALAEKLRRVRPIRVPAAHLAAAAIVSTILTGGCGGSTTSAPTTSPTSRVKPTPTPTPSRTPTPKPSPTQTPTPTPKPSPSATPTPAVTGHLFVANGSSVERFKIVGGIPKAPPDLIYGAAMPIALDSVGDLFATSPSHSAILVFPPGSTTPTRTLNLVLRNAVNIAATCLLVGPFGDLYVGYSADFTVRSGRPPESGVLIYAAGASGESRPLQRIIVGRGGAQGTVSGLVLDSRKELIVAVFGILPTNAVYAYSSPTKRPKRIRTLTGPAAMWPVGLALDSSEELYIDNLDPQNVSHSFIAALPVTASGSPQPDRQITIAGAKSLGFGITTSAGILFAPDSVGNAVYEAYATRNGQQSPISTLPFTSPTDVKLGQ